jgi:hypothetical protein
MEFNDILKILEYWSVGTLDGWLDNDFLKSRIDFVVSL